MRQRQADIQIDREIDIDRDKETETQRQSQRQAVIDKHTLPHTQSPNFLQTAKPSVTKTIALVFIV